ncbi:uncharacterized protein PHACADRAFT_195551 [Phanerochaete carnosa HHB-10118-sp]|uniref:Uncharacterized protein n=1 Tax=Phanerochaete carnosa (strain HHB-10118-sp) TaxID=650164 RepID=K5VVF9_PHACS|nr:uncharacterized protein PHACADRAFT_195551 [Phanerochaete carnosa HHB-10118-sp]EKM55518.1 hypothetical protein PHACADRAFT_195551 [Phanerochaete carnosa HHB-10118-sp]
MTTGIGKDIGQSVVGRGETTETTLRRPRRHIQITAIVSQTLEGGPESQGIADDRDTRTLLAPFMLEARARVRLALGHSLTRLTDTRGEAGTVRRHESHTTMRTVAGRLDLDSHRHGATWAAHLALLWRAPQTNYPVRHVVVHLRQMARERLHYGDEVAVKHSTRSQATIQYLRVPYATRLTCPGDGKNILRDVAIVVAVVVLDTGAEAVRHLRQNVCEAEHQQGGTPGKRH